MNLSLSIARRYLFSKGNRNVINIISGIAATGIAIGSFAMIIVLSAFNGLEALVSDLYTTIDPDIRISPAKGKTFDLEAAQLEGIAQWEAVEAAAPVLEETVFLQFKDHQTIVTLRGIPEAYLPNLDLEDFVIEGAHGLSDQGYPRALLGYGVADNLNLFISEGYEGVKVYAARRGAENALNPQSRFVQKRIVPMGIVALNPEFDFKYFYTPFQFATEVLQYENRASFIDLSLREGADAVDVKSTLETTLGPDFEVKTRMELNDVIFKTNATEKWVTFFILSFILIVGTFNLIGSLTMLIIDKKKDISLLRSVGQTVADVQRIFLFEGVLITAVGAAVGIGLGVGLVLVQYYVGFFPLEGGLVEYYPVQLELLDVAAVVGVVFCIGILASIIPVRVLLNNRRLQVVISS
ncbi:MAG: FtsX-like permease family protein [Cryomorphaceae bacterium]